MGKVYLSLLILYTILASFSEANNKESSDLLVRKKRIIDPTPNGDRPVPIEEVPYIVNILTNGRASCGGSILLSDLILTAAHCVELAGTYHILSGSSYANEGIRHSILNIFIHPNRRLRAHTYDLALLSIWPDIDFVRTPNQPITLYYGHVQPDTPCTVSGWGCNKIRCDFGCMCSITTKLTFPDELRSITVPAISLRECQRIYRYSYNTEKNICTHDKIDGKHCNRGDSGAPLVVNGELAGVYSWRVDCGNGPNVFMNLSHPEHRDWILPYIRHPPESPRNSSHGSSQNSPLGSPRNSSHGSLQNSPLGSPRNSSHGSSQNSPLGSPRNSSHGSLQNSPLGSPRNSSHGSSQNSPLGSPRNSSHGSLQNSPLGSPRNSSHGSLQNSPLGSPRNSSHWSLQNSPHGSPRNSLHGSSRNSPYGSPRNSSHGSSRYSPHSSPGNSLHGSSQNSPYGSPRRSH